MSAGAGGGVGAGGGAGGAPFRLVTDQEARKQQRLLRTSNLHNGIVYDSNRTLLIECMPSGHTVPQGAHRAARNNVVDALVQHFFKLPAGGRFKHVYYGTRNTEVPAEHNPRAVAAVNAHNQAFAAGRTVNIDEFLFDDIMHPNPGQVNAVVGAILKLFMQYGGNLPGADLYNTRMRHAYAAANDTTLGLPPDYYNDMLCDENLNFDYFRMKLYKMFKVGGFFLLICDCNSANERRTMRIRLSMLVTLEDVVLAPPPAGGPPEPDLDEQVMVRTLSRHANRNANDYGYKSTLPEYLVRPHGLRWLLEAICVYKLPTIQDHTVPPNTIGNFEYYDAPAGRIRTDITGTLAMQFLDVFARVNGIPEIRLESVFRSLNHIGEFDYVYGPAPAAGTPDTYEIGDWIVRYLPRNGTRPPCYQYGVITDLDPGEPVLHVRFWSEVVNKNTMDINDRAGHGYRKHDFENSLPVQLRIVPLADMYDPDLSPGKQIQYLPPAGGNNPWRNAVILNRTELTCTLDNGTADVPCHVRKLHGASRPNVDLTYLHEFYYRMGYDFDESNVLYAASSLRKCMEYDVNAWYHPDGRVPWGARANLDSDDHVGRLAIIRNRTYEKQVLLPNYTGVSAYVHPVENAPHGFLGSRSDTLISMIRRVSGLYKPGIGGLQVANGNPAAAPRLIGRDGRRQPLGRRMQSLTLQYIATEEPDGADERWRFREGVLDSAPRVQAAELGPSALVLVRQARLEVEGGAPVGTLRPDLAAAYALLVARQTRLEQQQAARRPQFATDLKAPLDRLYRERRERHEREVMEAQERISRELQRKAIEQKKKRKIEDEQTKRRQRLREEEEEESKSDVVVPDAQAAGVLALADPALLEPFGTMTTLPSQTTRESGTVTESVSSTLGYEGAAAIQLFQEAATVLPNPRPGTTTGMSLREVLHHIDVLSRSTEDHAHHVEPLRRRAAVLLAQATDMSPRDKQFIADQIGIRLDEHGTRAGGEGRGGGEVSVRVLENEFTGAGEGAGAYPRAPMQIDEAQMLAVVTSSGREMVVQHENGAEVALGPELAPPPAAGAAAGATAGAATKRQGQALLPFDIRTDGLTRERERSSPAGAEITPEATVASIERILQRPLNLKLRSIITDALTGMNPLSNDINEFIKMAKEHLRIINKMMRTLPHDHPVSEAFLIIQEIQYQASLMADGRVHDRERFIHVMRQILIAIETMDDPLHEIFIPTVRVARPSNPTGAPQRPMPLMRHEKIGYRDELQRQQQQMSGAAAAPRSAAPSTPLDGEGRGFRTRAPVDYREFEEEEEETKEDVVPPRVPNSASSSSSRSRRAVRGPPRKGHTFVERRDDGGSGDDSDV